MQFVTEAARQTPVTARFDVAVCGGGIAGVAAAMAAARQGAQVCVIEKESLLGGLATAGLIAIYLPLCDGRGRQVIGGIGEELLKLSVQYYDRFDRSIPDCWCEGGDPAQRSQHRYQTEFDPWLFAIAMEEELLRLGVTLIYDSRVCGVAMNGNRVGALLLENKSGRMAVEAAMVVDATGDADICYLAGERTATVAKNRLAAWHYTHDGQKLHLRPQAVPLYQPLPPGRRFYDGTNWQWKDSFGTDTCQIT
jgi:flavin-dependent dehydrogenase